MRLRIPLTLVLFAASAVVQPASAQPVATHEIAEGGVWLGEEIAASLSIGDDGVALSEDLAGALRSAMPMARDLDLGAGIALDRPQTVTLARPDGSSDYLEAAEGAYIFPEPDSLRLGDALTTLTGGILFRAEIDGRPVWRFETGSLSLIAE